MYMAAPSLEGPPGPTTDGDNSDNAWGGQGMSMLTCPHLTMLLTCCMNCMTGPSSLHTPYRSAPHGYTLCIALPLVAAHITSLYPLQLHTPHHGALRGCTHRVTMLLVPAYSTCMLSFFFFLLTSSFAVQSPCPNGTMVMWPQGCDSDNHSCGNTRRNDSHYNCNTT